jgi:hypothetical protein
MIKEKIGNFFRISINPFYKGVCKMKPLRIFMLMALLVLPLFASSVLADFTADTVNIGFGGNKKISENTINQPILGFSIPTSGGDVDTLKEIILKSFIERAYSVGFVKLWVETNNTPGWQITDTHLKTVNTLLNRFETQDTIVFSGLNRVIKANADTFYFTIDAHTDSVKATPYLFNEHGLDVVIEEGRIELGASSGQTNINRLNNLGWNFGPPTFFDPFKLIFDTYGPTFDLHFCIEDNTCSTYTYYGTGPRLLNVDHEDSVRICAKNISPDIMGDITVIGKVHLLGYVSSERMFGLSSIKLKSPDAETGGCSDGEVDWCDTNYTTSFRIPDVNTSGFQGVDADSGHWYICAYASDSSGNVDTICIGNDLLPYRIDTEDPIIDSITWEFTHDMNSDGKIGLGDSIMIIGWGLSNPWEPQFEAARMEVDWSWYSGTPDDWRVLDDVKEHNRIFRKVFGLTNPVDIDSSGGCPINFLVRAWDNACNWDTLTGKICADVDLDPPSLEVRYEWNTDYDTAFGCMGIDDKVLIHATVEGTDIVSVTAMMDSAGIDQLMQHAMPLTLRGGGVYDTIWIITEPPILYGKDADNTQPPFVDNIYTIPITACDDVGNCVTALGTLNKTLDTRLPRPIGFFCLDSMTCALTAKALAGGIVELKWDTACDENDAFYYYVWADDGTGSGYDSIGATNVAEQTPGSKYFTWHSEPLAEGYWKFKIKTQDNCSNIGPFSCEVGVVVDTTPPNACIVYPDSGGTYGYPFPIKARSEDPDIESVALWYRLWPNYPSDAGVSQWYEYGGDMDRYDDGFVFLEEFFFLHGYMGWVEVLPLSCDVVGNCQDTNRAYDEACLDDDLGNLVNGHFLFYLDTTRCVVTVVSVNDTISPQTSCGYNVNADSMNQVIINVPGAATGDTFTIDVRAISDDSDNRIDYRNHVTMPCTLMVSVDNWDQGTQRLYVYVTNESNDINCIPDPLVIELCVPPQEAPCMRIVDPVEWQRVPCSKTDKTEVCITAETIPGCGNQFVTQVEFRVSTTGEPPWYYIGEDVTPIPKSEPIVMDEWEVCWNNKEFIEQNGLQDGDPVYLIAIGFDQYHMADTSHMVKVYLDCSSPNIQLFVEPKYHTCASEDSVISCEPLTFKAIVLDTMVDITYISFYAKKHSDPDIFDYWHRVGESKEPFNANLWSYTWDDPCYCPVDDLQDFPPRWGLCSGLLYDFRIGAEDQADNEFLDYDEDGRFDDATFNTAVALGAGMTLFVDGEAPQPAITKVCDMGQQPPICVVNPSEWMDGTGKAYVQAGSDIYVEVSPLPSEDTCTVMKVEYFLQIMFDWVHVGTSTEPNHYPITFNPLADGLIRPVFFENGYWKSHLKAVLYDSLGNSKEDTIHLYVLDVTPTQAIIIEPLNDSYVSGDVTLKAAAINHFEICKVCYEYSSDGATWYPVNDGYPNACVNNEGGMPGGGAGIIFNDFELTWHTLNTVPDGVYYLRAVATDCDNNVDDDPPTIRVTVTNELPTVVMDDPRICERTCPDGPEDTLGYVGGTVTLYATASSTVPIEYVMFWYKDIFDPKFSYKEIGRDYFPTNGKYSIEWNTGSLSDGRYFIKAEVHNAAGKWGQSDPPITVSVDNSGPFAQIISIDGNPFPDGMDITKGQVLDIEIVAIDSTSSDGWTRCYNSGLTSVSLCFESSKPGDEITKCFTLDPAEDGFNHFQWNTSGLDFKGCDCWYYLYVKAYDCLGNETITQTITIYIYDVTAPVTTIGGFDKYYDSERKDYLYAIYGYSDEEVSSLLFEYAPKGTSNWIPIGWSSAIHEYCDYYLYKTSIDGKSLPNGDYWFRVISHDTCSNQDDSLAPIAIVTVLDGEITPSNPGVLGEMTFEKNWCVGGMHGIVRQTSTEGTPVVLVKYNSHDFECVDMQYHLQNTTEYAGSFYAEEIDYGGPAEFYSSITVKYTVPPSTGDPTMITYLLDGGFDVAEVKTDLGTHGTYQQGCVEVTIQAGAVDHNEYIWVAPTEMAWAPVNQSDIMPIGDRNGNATYISFTDCYYCCGQGGYASSWFGNNFGWDQTAPLTAAPMGAGGDGYGYCCFNEGRYAKIKMCYDTTITTDAAHLAVMWWDCEAGKYKDRGINYPNGVEGFNIENHTVEFATTCLEGPFVVVQLIERHCSGSIVVNMLDVEPYCNGYTNATPQFKAFITDNVKGPDGINKHSIQFKADLFTEGDLVRIYDGSHYDDCHKWATGFGSFQGSGYDKVSGIFRAGWNDSTYLHSQGDTDEWQYCDQCYTDYFGSDYLTWCRPMYPMAEGDHMAVLTAMNDQIQTCTDTVHIMVDATKPWMAFADSIGAYVGKNPHICMYLKDIGAGIDKNSVYVDVFGDNYDLSNPTQHYFISTVFPDQMNWVNDTTVCFDFTFEYTESYGYLHMYVYGGPQWKCNQSCPSTQYYGYMGGIADCVGNRLNPFWRYFNVDSQGPDITAAYNSICDSLLRFAVTDDKAGVLSVTVSEDGVLMNLIVQDVNNPSYWWYTPTEGKKKVTIEATDKLGNKSYLSFDIPSDCEEPTVSFENEYVCKNPTIKFKVTDPNGVDWSSVNVYIDGCGGYCSYFAPDLTSHTNTTTGLVTLDACNMDCTDGNIIKVYVYSGTNKTGTGPCDLDGNCGTYRVFTFVVDAVVPDISVGSTDDRPILITITDDRSGVDWSSFQLYEDGVLITDETVVVLDDTSNGLVKYNPSTFGKDVIIKVTDKTGCNVATASFTTEEDFLAFGNPHNSPNPFNPNSEETWIYPDLSKSAYVTIKIYDFAGEFVRKICDNEWMNSGSHKIWDGKTDGGTTVGNGTYLCYIHARDESGRTKTAVIKITVLKQDE